MRYYHRFPIEGHGQAILPDKTQQPLIVKDISSRGAGIISNIPFRVSAMIKVFIDSTAFNPPIDRRAMVVWSKRLDENLWESGLDFGEDRKVKLY